MMYLFFIGFFILHFTNAELERCDSGDVSVRPVSTPVVHGEGPHWDHRRQVLYFVDTFNQTVNRFDPTAKTLTSVFIEGGPVTVVIPTQRDGQFIISRGRDLAALSWDGFSSHGPLRILATVDKEKPKNRFNDGKADASGRLWVGTRGIQVKNGVFTPRQGSLYSFSWNDNFRPKLHISGATVSNGIGWSKNDTLMFYIDSPTRKIDVFDFDIKCGKFSNRRVGFDFDDYNIPGIPDGMAVDEDDRLWIAVYNGSRVIQVDPLNGELLRTVNMPVKQVTSCAFGGPGLGTLYVTTSQRGLPSGQQPQAGALFALQGLGVRGQRKSNIAKYG